MLVFTAALLAAAKWRETTCLQADGRGTKRGALFSLKQEGTVDTGHNMGEPEAMM